MRSTKNAIKAVFASLLLAVHLYGQGGYIMGPSSGSGGGSSTQLFASTASATVANTGTETTIIGAGTGSLTLAANFFSAGQVLYVHATGIYSTIAMTAGTLNIRLKFGSTVIVATGDVTATDNLTNEVWTLDVVVTCRTAGGSGTVIAESVFRPTVGTVVQNGWKMLNTSTVTVDTTATQAVQLTADWGTADPGNTITGTNFVMGGTTPVPSQTGNGGKFLGTNGTSMAWDFPVATGTYATIPAAAASNTGRIYLPNNGYFLARSSGSAYTAMGPVFPVTIPSDSGFAWVNQNSATLTTANGGLVVQNSAGSSGFSSRVITEPATPYTLTVIYRALFSGNGGTTAIGWRESGTNKATMFRATYVNTSAATAENYFNYAQTNYTAINTGGTFSADVGTVRRDITPPGDLIFCLSNDGANLQTFWSADGQVFSTFQSSVAINSFFTTAPDQLVFATASSGIAVNQNTIAIISWKTGTTCGL